MPFVLDLLRHGDALPAAAGGDAARRLSPRGIDGLERLARRLAGLGWRPDHAFASPLVRARESARIVLAIAAPALAVETFDPLRPEGAPDDVISGLVERAPTPGLVLLVGHQPLLGDLAARLAGTPAPAFAPGTLVRVEFADTLAAGAGRATLRLAPADIP